MSRPQFPVPTTIIYTHEDGIEDVFVRYEEIGYGGYSIVYRTFLQSSNKTYAMKVISKKYAKSKGKLAIKEVKNEMKIQKKLYHPNIVRSKLSFSDDDNYYIILEYCPGKSIREYLRKSKNGYLTENETRKILRDVVRGLVFLHNNNIVHHDIKLENFVIGLKGKVKIADFGLSTHLKDEDQKQYLAGGTTNYLSPEIIQKKEHSFKVDIWAIGISAFVMLTGKAPFDSPQKETIYEKILSCKYKFPSNIIISEEAKNFITSTLQIDPKNRPTAHDLSNHPFLTKIDEEDVKLFDPVQLIKEKVHSSQLPQKVVPTKSIQSCPKFHSNRAMSPLLSNKDQDLNATLKNLNFYSPARSFPRRLLATSTMKTINSDEDNEVHKKPNYIKCCNIYGLQKISPFC